MEGGVREMNYDGPSYYKKRESNDPDEKSQKMATPLERLKNEQKRRNELNEQFMRNQQQRKEMHPENYYFRSTQIPKSLQNRDELKEEAWDQEVVSELEDRLKKEPENYLLFSEDLPEDKLEEVPKTDANKSVKLSAEEMKIKKMVAEIESTLDTAALVQHEIKPDLRKPNTGIHRTLSNIISEDKIGLNKKKKI